MTKGNQGESCAEAVRSSLKPGEVAAVTVRYGGGIALADAAAVRAG